MTFSAEKVDSADQKFATFKVDASSVHYPIGYIVWGNDSGTQNIASSASPFPVHLQSGQDTVVTVTGYTAPSTTFTQTGYVAPSTTVTVTGYTAPSTVVTAAISSFGTYTDGTNSALRVNVVAGSAGGDSTITVTNAPSSNAIDANNTSTSALSSAATFTGVGTDVSGYNAVTIHVKADEPSADSGMTFQFSTDNTNWDDIYRFTFSDTAGARRFQFPVTAQYFRTVYTNGSSAQSAFRIQTILHATDVTQSIHRLGDTALTGDRSVNVSKAAIVAQRGGTGNFIPVNATGGGNLQFSLEEGANDSSSPVFVSNDTSTPIQTTYVGRQQVGLDALSSAGGLQTSVFALDSTAQTVTSSAARLFGYHIGNPDTAGNVFVKFYQDDSGGVTLGTSSAVMDLFVPFGGGAVMSPDGIGIDMDSGISIAAAGGGGSTDHTAPSTTLYATVWFKDVSG